MLRYQPDAKPKPHLGTINDETENIQQPADFVIFGISTVQLVWRVIGKGPMF